MKAPSHVAHYFVASVPWCIHMYFCIFFIANQITNRKMRDSLSFDGGIEIRIMPPYSGLQVPYRNDITSLLFTEHPIRWNPILDYATFVNKFTNVHKVPRLSL
jgi:hypothetical protein